MNNKISWLDLWVYCMVTYINLPLSTFFLFFSIQSQAFSLNSLFSESGLDESSPDVIAGKSKANTFLFFSLNKDLDNLYASYSQVNQKHKKEGYSQEFIDSFKYFANPYGKYGKAFLEKERVRQSKFDLTKWIYLAHQSNNKKTLLSKESSEFDLDEWLTSDLPIRSEQEFCNRISDEGAYLLAVQQACPAEFSDTVISGEYISRYYLAQGCKAKDDLNPGEQGKIAAKIFNGVQYKMAKFGANYCSIERKEANLLLQRYQNFFNVK